MNIERGFVPISDAQSERVMIKIPFPEFVDDQRIGVNVREIHRLCQIGGIRKIAVIGIDDLDTSRSEPQILGFNEQGSAYMGKAVSKTEAPVSLSDSGYTEGYYHTERWTNAVIAVDMNALKERVVHDKRWPEGVRSPSAWSHYLNKGIKDGISNEGTIQLLSLNPKVRLALFTAAVGLDVSGIGFPFFSTNHPHFPEITETASHYFVSSSVWNIVDRVISGGSVKDSKARYTLFYGPEVDRAILLKILTKTRTLVKQIEPQSNDSNPTL